MSKTRRYTRQIPAPNKDYVSLNERCSVSIIQDRAVVLKEGLRIIGFFDKWPDPDKLEYIRDEFVRVMRDPRNAPDPDWAVLAA
ncbi:hypothetical protein GCM10007933_17670 [Zoogloea oryzae]|uniref:Uncharacterized protein n=1 Tax=Zoogloea oryzae TaxID=310767 RepID=A0ABQ6F9T5_9RHOO|nr:hypothetical protein [Zoogloea oryzae]GLT22308.1 hypothetical protein GCM10007933_17670 [Zoogloea oryzae]